MLSDTAGRSRKSSGHQHDHEEDVMTVDQELGPHAVVEPYATPANVQTHSLYVLQSVATLGIPTHGVDLSDNSPSGLAKVVNLLHTLVQQRQSDRDARQDLEEAAHKLRFENQRMRKELANCENAIKEQYTKQGNLELKLRQASRAGQTASTAASAKQTSDARLIKKLEGVVTQAEVRIKAKDQEIESLRSRLSAALANRHPQPAAVGLSQEGGAGDPTGGWGAPDQQVAASPAPSKVRQKGAARNTQPGAAAAHQELHKAQARASQALSQVRQLEEEKRQLESRLAATEDDLTRLIARCRSLGVPVADSEFPTAQTAGPGGKTQPAAAPTDAELHAYLVTDMQVVQDRCTSLLHARGQRGQLTSATASRSASLGGVGGSAGGAGAGTSQKQQEVDQLLREQGQALQRAMAMLKRVEAQRDAAQMRAAAEKERAHQLQRVQHPQHSAQPTQPPAAVHTELEVLRARCAELEQTLDTRHHTLDHQAHARATASPSASHGSVNKGQHRTRVVSPASQATQSVVMMDNPAWDPHGLPAHAWSHAQDAHLDVTHSPQHRQHRHHSHSSPDHQHHHRHNPHDSHPSASYQAGAHAGLPVQNPNSAPPYHHGGGAHQPQHTATPQHAWQVHAVYPGSQGSATVSYANQQGQHGLAPGSESEVPGFREVTPSRQRWHTGGAEGPLGVREGHTEHGVGEGQGLPEWVQRLQLPAWAQRRQTLTPRDGI